MPAPRRLRHTLGAVAGTVALLTAAPPLAAPATADTGGRVLAYNSAYHGFVATAAHPRHRFRLPTPRLPGDEMSTFEQIVPSPDGRRLATAVDAYRETRRHILSVTTLVVTDRHGGHQHVVWTRTRRSVFPDSVAGMTWSADGRRLYFGVVVRPASGPTTRILGTRVRGTTPGPLVGVPGSRGLAWPTADPTGTTLAAVRSPARSCVRPGADPRRRTATLVVLHPRTGSSYDLTSVTTPPQACASPIEHPAWSPDGTSIAFDTDWTRSDQREVADVRVVSVDGTDHTPRMVVSGHGRHIATSPAWQSAHSLWFQWKPIADSRYDSTSDLYSTRLAHGVWQPKVDRTHIRRYSHRVFNPSFG